MTEKVPVKLRFSYCLQCQRTYNSDKTCEHLAEKPNMSYTCECGEKFDMSVCSTAALYEVHVKSNKCSRCDRVFPCEGHLKKHQETEPDCIKPIQLTCSSCYHIFPNYEMYLMHKESAKCICTFCNNSFGCEIRLAEHVRQFHPNPAQINNQTPNPLSSIKRMLAPLPAVSTSHKCSTCKYRYFSMENYRKHMAENRFCSGCNITFGCINELRAHEKLQLPCSVCSHLVHKGQEQHHFDRPCPICKYRFKCVKQFEQHFAKYCGQVTNFACRYCKQSVGNWNDLQKHILYKRCANCGQECACRTFLQQHYEQSHSQMLTCAYCRWEIPVSVAQDHLQVAPCATCGEVVSCKFLVAGHVCRINPQLVQNPVAYPEKLGQTQARSHPYLRPEPPPPTQHQLWPAQKAALTGLMNFDCPICSEVFDGPAGLGMHVKACHPKVPSKPPEPSQPQQPPPEAAETIDVEEEIDRKFEADILTDLFIKPETNPDVKVEIKKEDVDVEIIEEVCTYVNIPIN
ncbi:histone-lysine N-methyltransferase PRDM9-like [Neocloeon triangulifer]|uniref:histone-lysine N-methyltransferase PRDM9-like n=1 Tax=Neocloeon triangulifer TaxID=2078957 RepID=UPI00286FA142|nr:histone-lysine N-methyltransferase PRDM9-like [Neocloeon triangulifer]XP_059488783.1 histone-lysine N-methyltransferase PRDM9-like [Neocloeon triangulifer]